MKSIILIIVIVLAGAFSGCVNSKQSTELQKLNLTNHSGGTKIIDILTNPRNYTNNVVISGTVSNVMNTQTKTPPVTYTTYFEIDDGTGKLWAATQAQTPISIPVDTKVTVTGFLMSGFRSTSINKTFDLIIFANPNDLIISPTTMNQTSNQSR
jgi:hypothetical protein